MRYLLVIIVFIAFILRVVNINQSFWLDEGISISTALNLSYTDIIKNFSPGDFHPPLYYLLLKSVISQLGTSELAVRSLSIISGVLTVFVTFLLTKKIYDKNSAYVSSSLVATSPLLIYYSQEARMYSIATLFSVTSLYFFISLLKNDKIIYWTGFIVTTVIAIYLDYMPLLIMPSYLFFLIISRKKYKKFTIKTFIPALILIVAGLLPWMNIFIKQFENGLNLNESTPSWESIIGSTSVKDLAIIYPKFILGRISPDNDWNYFFIFLPIGIFVSIMLIISAIRLNYVRLTLWFYILVPIIFSFLISFFVPIFSYFRLIFVLPALYILIASAICNLNWSKPKNVLFLIMILINLSCTGIYLINPKFQREDWKTATKFVNDTADDNSVVLFESNFVVPTFDLYNKSNIKAFGALNSFTPNEESVEQNINKYTAQSRTIYLFQYLAPISDPQGLVFNSLIKNNFNNTQTKDFRGVGFVYVFEK